VALASENLERFVLVNRALTEEKDARLEAEASVRKEVEGVAAAMGDAIRDADADHAGLVEAVHRRIVARLAAQDDVSSVVQEALENKRAFLEGIVRAEIATRFAGMEELKSELQSRHAECKKELGDSKDEIKAEMHLLQTKSKAHARSIRNQSVAVESVQRQAEQVRADVKGELESIVRAQTQAEEQLRAHVSAQTHDVRLQLSVLHETVQGMHGQEDVSQEHRDLEQDRRMEKLSELHSEQDKRLAQMHSDLQMLAQHQRTAATEINGKHAVLKEDVQAKLAQQRALSGEIRESLQSMLQGTDQQVHELRVQMLGLRDEAQRASPALLQETSNRLSTVEKAVSTVEKAWETRVSAVESSTLSTFRDLREEHTRMDEAHAAFAQQVRAESARLSEAGKEVGVMIEAQARGLKAVQEDMVLRLKRRKRRPCACASYLSRNCGGLRRNYSPFSAHRISSGRRWTESLQTTLGRLCRRLIPFAQLTRRSRCRPTITLRSC